jgi:WD40 repeat protein
MSTADGIDREQQLDEVLAAYLEAAENGWAPDRQRLLACYPHLADDLARFFANLDRVERAAAPLRSVGEGVMAPPASGTTLRTMPAPVPAPDPCWPVIPGYEVLGELGRGGMGVVYKAWQVGLKRPVALKVIRASLYAGPQEVSRFRAEAIKLARAEHPNIVHVYEVGEHAGCPFFAMEFLEGGSLADTLAGTPLPPPQAAELVGTLARAVHASHQRGIIHRDLKPANVLLTPDGVPKVSDFGLSKGLDAEVGVTTSGAVIGTPSYMAPEQAAGKSREVGPAADVYALGAILYELLTGRPPFRAATPMDTLLQVISDEPVPPRRLQPHAPRDLETICLKCLQKAPGKRYASAAALAEDLQRYRAGRPILARPVGPAGRGWRWCRRNPAVAGLLTAVASALLAGTAVATLFAIRANQNASQARASERRANDRAYTADLRLVQRAWEENQLGLVRELLEGQRPEKADGVERRGFEWYYWWRLSHRELQTLEGHTGAVVAVSFSPDGRRLASASHDGSVKVWDAQAGQELLTLRGHAGSVSSVCFSPDGRRLASASYGRLEGKDEKLMGGEVTVWDAQTGRELLSLRGSPVSGGTPGPVQSVAFSPDGRRLAGALRGYDKQTKHEYAEVKVWDAQTGEEALSLRGPLWTTVYGIAFSPDGRRLAGAASDGTVKLWDVQTGQEVAPLKGHTGEVRGVGFSPDGSRLASASWDHTVRVWDVQTGKELLTFKGHTDPVGGVCFSPDGRRLASASQDLTARVWDAQTGQEVATLKGHTGPVIGVRFSPDGRRLASVGDQTVRVWDAETAQESLTLKAVAAVAVCFSPDGTRLASASPDGTAKVWDAQTGQELLTLRHTGLLRAVCFSPDGQRLACTTDWTEAPEMREITEVRVWDAQTGQDLLKWHPDGVHGVLGVCFSPDGRRLAGVTGAYGEVRAGKLVAHPGEVRVWDAQTGEELHTFKGPESGLNPASAGVCFSPDGRRVAGAFGMEAEVWDAETGQEVLTIRGGPSDGVRGVHGVCFSPDGRRLASVGERTVKVWDAQTGQEALTLKGYAFGGVAFSPDGKRLASASLGQTVRLWDAETGQEVATLKGHTGPVLGVCFSPDGTHLASASEDGTVRVWDATPQDERSARPADPANAAPPVKVVMPPTVVATVRETRPANAAKP